MNKYTLLIFIAGFALFLFSLYQGKSAFAAIDTQLDFGDTGPEVTELQEYLAEDSTLYPEGLVTGFFGPLTQAAVERFQTRHAIVSSGTPETTGFGRVGPLTMAKLNELMGTTVPPSNGTNGVGGPEPDIWAPIMSQETVSPGATSATITWTTNKPAFGRVMHGTSFPFLYATAPSVSDMTFDQQTNITLTGLEPNTTYYYVRESIDLMDNIMLSTARTFTTTFTDGTTGGTPTTTPTPPPATSSAPSDITSNTSSAPSTDTSQY